METKINMSELTLINVNSYWFFNYLAMELDEVNEFNVDDFYNLLTHIKNGKYKNILAEFMMCESTSRFINLCNKYYNNVKNNNLTIIYDYEKILINLDCCGSRISLIITDFNKNIYYYNIHAFINDYLEYEAEMLNNE